MDRLDDDMTDDPTIDDETTMAQVRRVYESDHERLWRSVYGFCGSRTVADDSVAEAFAQSLRFGEAIDDMRAWPSAFDIARGELRRSSISPDRPGGHDVADTADRSAGLEQLMAALAELSDADRELLVLCHVGGWTAGGGGARRFRGDVARSPAQGDETGTTDSGGGTMNKLHDLDAGGRPRPVGRHRRAAHGGSGESTTGTTLFALPSNDPIRIQIIGEPGTTPADPFALAERPRSGSQQPHPRGPSDRRPRHRSAGVRQREWEAVWELDDGTKVYLRSRRLDRDDLIELIGQLSARPLDDPLPGVDLFPGRFELLHEG